MHKLCKSRFFDVLDSFSKASHYCLNGLRTRFAINVLSKDCPKSLDWPNIVHLRRKIKIVIFLAADGWCESREILLHEGVTLKGAVGSSMVLFKNHPRVALEKLSFLYWFVKIFLCKTSSTMVFFRICSRYFSPLILPLWGQNSI